VKFGLKEMREFAAASGDPRIEAMMRRIEEHQSKKAKWCQLVASGRLLLQEVLDTEDEANHHNSGILDNEFRGRVEAWIKSV